MHVLLAMWLAAAPPGKAVLVDRIVATVEGRVITRSAVEGRVVRFRETPAQALDALVERTLFQVAADAAGIEATSHEVDTALGEILAKNQLTLAQLAEALKKQGWEMAAYRDEIAAQLRELKWVQLQPTRDRAKLLEGLKRVAAVEVRP